MNAPDPRSVPQQLQTLVDALADPDAVAQQVTGRRRAQPGSRRAAVLIMIGEQELDLTFTERAATLRNHPGQISFPGGRLDPGETATEAALRESWEEVGLDPAEVTVLGQLPLAHVPASGFDVAGIVGLWSGTTPVAPVDAGEVALVHRFRLADLADPAHRVTWRIPGHSGPAFVFDDVMVWGFTAYLTDLLLELGGFTRDWPREVERPVPERFLRRATSP